MTLPFRRRHDAEASHERARALVSTSFLEALPEPDVAWLDAHLAGCEACRAEREAFLADRLLLRSLRDRSIVPPRDLWARTAAAIEGQARPGRGRLANLGLARPAAGPRRRAPVGVLAGALVVLVVVATALAPHGVPIGPNPTGGASNVAVASSLPGPTPLIPDADRVAWVQKAADGSYSLVFADVDHACPEGDPTCAPLADGSPAPLTLAAPPQAVVLSPGSDQIAVVGSADETGGSVAIVSVPTPHPVATSTPGASSSSPLGTPTPTATSAASPVATSPAAPGSGHVIVSGVVVVGAAGYSADGQWFAFSASPRDGSGGPDLYVWHLGDDLARRVTTDGATFFSGWYGDQILASGIVAAAPSDGASPSPDDATPGPDDATPAPDDASPSPDLPSTSPSGDGSPTPSATGEAHPFSVLVDPVTGERVEFGLPDVWLPTVDPTGRFVTYWSGTVTPADPTVAAPFLAGQVAAWRPATGRLVLDGWSAPLAPEPSASAAASDEPDSAEPSPGAASPSAPASAGPDGASPAPTIGPAGTPIELAVGPIADFDARFDPTGTRLAVWVLDSPEASAGRLRLLALDPALGGLDPAVQPMAATGVQALRGFSIESGRLGWATPAGQDGQPSSVQVLAWKGDDFGQVQPAPGGNPQIVR